ncbi:MAG: hypothetical protein JO257_28575 [Deltaproteobacteria bacterium]|nr:hypothetical protein [Deltaproteobacteria bacterium]
MRLAALFIALLACHSDPQPIHPKPGDLPPLPPASGTPIGYLIDAQADLNLRPDQLTQLKDIDTSLAARDAEIDTQLRQIERPEEEEPLEAKDIKNGKKPPRHAYAPGAAVHSSADAQKLHKLRDRQDQDAVQKALALLDAAQVEKAKSILADHDVQVPGAPKKNDAPSAEDGQPVPGMEP